MKNFFWIFLDFYPICSWFFSELEVDTKNFLPHKVRQVCRLLFVLSKFPSWSMTPSGSCQKYIFSFFSKKISFIFLVLSPKYPHLRLEKFTRLWALEHKDFVTPSADNWTFLLVPKRDMPSRLSFFFADFVTCANFSNLCGKFLKTHNRYGHHVSAKSCASSWATFSLKKIEKNRLFGFFLKRNFEKTLFLTVFYVWSPISQNQDQIQGPWFRIIYKRFVGYIFAKNYVKVFSDCAFWAKKG